MRPLALALGLALLPPATRAWISASQARYAAELGVSAGPVDWTGSSFYPFSCFLVSQSNANVLYYNPILNTDGTHCTLLV